MIHDELFQSCYSSGWTRSGMIHARMCRRSNEKSGALCVCYTPQAYTQDTVRIENTSTTEKQLHHRYLHQLQDETTYQVIVVAAAVGSSTADSVT